MLGSHYCQDLALSKWNCYWNLEMYKSKDNNQIPAELMEAGGEILCSERYRLIRSIWNKDELPQLLKESITVPIHKMGDKTDGKNYRRISLLSTAYKILSNILPARLTPYVNEIIREHQCGFSLTDLLPIRFSTFGRYYSKMGVYWDSASALNKLRRSLWLG
jgi:hypothetical protein